MEGSPLTRLGHPSPPQRLSQEAGVVGEVLFPGPRIPGAESAERVAKAQERVREAARRFADLR